MGTGNEVAGFALVESEGTNVEMGRVDLTSAERSTILAESMETYYPRLPSQVHEGSTNLVKIELSKEYIDLYTSWNFTFLLSFTGLNPIGLSILFLPTLLAQTDYWLHGRAYSLFLAIHA